jgi:hypothetical protein
MSIIDGGNAFSSFDAPTSGGTAFSDVFSDWLTHTVVVERYLGVGIEGALFDTPIIVGGDSSEINGAEVMIEPTRRLIRSSDGNEIVSETTLYVSAQARDIFVMHSRVELPNGTISTVERVAELDVFGLFDHLVVNLA